MTLEELHEAFKDTDDQYGKFDSISHKMSGCADLHAFLMLSKLVDMSGRDMVACAEHDVIWLETTPEELAKVISKEEVVDLVRCRISYSNDEDSLWMFV